MPSLKDRFESDEFKALKPEEQAEYRRLSYQHYSQKPEFKNLPDGEKEEFKKLVLGPLHMKNQPQKPAEGFWSKGIPGAVKQAVAGGADFLMGTLGDLGNTMTDIGMGVAGEQYAPP